MLHSDASIRPYLPLHQTIVTRKSYAFYSWDAQATLGGFCLLSSFLSTLRICSSSADLARPRAKRQHNSYLVIHAHAFCHFAFFLHDPTRHIALGSIWHPNPSLLVLFTSILVSTIRYCTLHEDERMPVEPQRLQLILAFWR